MTPSSFSIYRGQSKDGIGDARGSVHRGEQYIAADAPFAADQALLEAIRTWMTFDIRPADYQAFGDRLEAWSCFPHGSVRFVCRLMLAGRYIASDPRIAYLAHGRAWRASEIAGSFDPGAHLGRADAFEQRATLPAKPAPEPECWWSASVDAEPAFAARLLAHLYQGLLDRCPVVVAAPVSDFARGAAIHGLVAFARAALPLPLKRDYRARIYTSDPCHFIRELEADLVVAPADVAPAALRARPDAVLLDRRGAVLAGRLPSAGAAAYAEVVVSSARRFPRALLAFSARGGEPFSARAPAAAGREEIVKLTYALAVTAGSSEQLGELLVGHMMRVANRGGLDPEELIEPAEWSRIPEARLVEVLLMGTESSPLTEGGRTLQRLVEAEAQRRRISVDDSLPHIWPGPSTRERVTRLVELASLSLVSPGGAGRATRALRTADIDLESAVRILRIELEAGVLAERACEATDLAWLAQGDVQVVDVLLEATERGALGTEWLLTLAEGDFGPALVQAIVRGLASERALGDAVLERLLDLATRCSQPPRGLGAAAADAAEQRNPDERYFVLLEIAARSGEPRAAALRLRLRELRDRDLRARVVATAGDPERRAVGPEDVIGADGVLLLPDDWIEDIAGALLASPLAARLTLGARMRLWGALPAGDPLCARAVADIDQQMSSEPEAVTRALVSGDGWLSWRQLTGLASDRVRVCALAWLRCDAHRRTEVGAIWDGWRRVIVDLEGCLSYREMESLHNREVPGTSPARRAAAMPRRPSSTDERWGPPRWPVVPAHFAAQLEDLARLADDPRAIAELSRAASTDASADSLLLKRLVEASRFARWGIVEALCGASRTSTRAALALGREGGDTDDCWTEITRAARDGCEHPFVMIGKSVSSYRASMAVTDLDHRGFDNLLRVLERHPTLLCAPHGSGDLVPLGELALQLSDWSLGETYGRLLDVLFHIHERWIASSTLETSSWWQALRRALTESRRAGGQRRADDSVELAWSRVRESARRRLSPLARKALFAADRQTR